MWHALSTHPLKIKFFLFLGSDQKMAQLFRRHIIKWLNIALCSHYRGSIDSFSWLLTSNSRVRIFRIENNLSSIASNLLAFCQAAKMLKFPVINLFCLTEQGTIKSPAQEHNTMTPRGRSHPFRTSYKC